MIKNTLFAAALASGAFIGAAQATPVQWTGVGSNGHWYELDTSTTYSSFAAAVAGAASHTYSGMTGYLATITSAGEQAFVNGISQSVVWLGGSDAASEGAWEWVTEPGGPVAFAYTNWAPFEPNNAGAGEDGLLGWWSSNGSWNDIGDGYSSFGVLVEYSAAPSISAVPVPAGLPLILTGLGALAALKRRRKAA